jgi:hypothetical protein
MSCSFSCFVCQPSCPGEETGQARETESNMCLLASHHHADVVTCVTVFVPSLTPAGAAAVDHVRASPLDRHLCSFPTVERSAVSVSPSWPGHRLGRAHTHMEARPHLETLVATPVSRLVRACARMSKPATVRVHTALVLMLPSESCPPTGQASSLNHPRRNPRPILT